MTNSMSAYKDDKHTKHDDYANLRSNIKGTTFGVPYGAGAQCVANNTGLSLDEASDLITRFFAKAGVLKLWLDKPCPGFDARLYQIPARTHEVL